MSVAALSQDAFAPRQPAGMGSGLALAILAHLLLIAALAWSVNWKTSEPEGVVAELWSALPQIAAPRPSPPEPRPPAVEVKPPPPAPKVEPTATPRIDPQIAIEQAREKAHREQADRIEAARQAEIARREHARKEDAEREKQRLADAQAEKKKLADKAKQDEAKQAAIREANLRRMMAQAGSSDDPSASGKAVRTSGPSATYAGRIRAAIRPNIVDIGDIPSTATATVEVRLAPDGTIVGKKLLKSSGTRAWDEMVLRAIEKTGILPTDIDGRVPPPFPIEFRRGDS